MICPNLASWPGRSGHIMGTQGCVAISPSPTSLVPEKPWLVWWGMESQWKHVPGFMGTCAVLLSTGWLCWAVVSLCHHNSPCPLAEESAPTLCWHPRLMALQGCPAWKAQHGHHPAQSQAVPVVPQSWGWECLGRGEG